MKNNIIVFTLNRTKSKKKYQEKSFSFSTRNDLYYINIVIDRHNNMGNVFVTLRPLFYISRITFI